MVMLSPSTRSSVFEARQKGGAILAVIAGLLVVAASTLAIRMASQVTERTQLQQLTVARMQRIEAGLHAFAASHGRLPCPANGAQDTGLAVPAAAVLSCPPASSNGAVPWVTLGLQADDALDGWGRKMSYRVADGANGLTRASGVGSAGTMGMSVSDGGVLQTAAAWVLISHGPSGLGAWRRGMPRMALPGAGGNEWNNSQAPPTVFFRRGETLVNPATGTDYVPTDVAHFDDVLLFESIADVEKQSGLEPVVVRLTTARLDSLLPVAYTGRNSNTTAMTFDSGTTWGQMTVTSTAGNIARNFEGTGIGVCSGTCSTDSTSALDNTKALRFRINGPQTAEKFALGVLSLDPTAQVSVTFRNAGVAVGNYVSVAPPAPAAAVTTGVVKVFENLQPAPPSAFNEVEIQPVGTSRFFIASIRFCTAVENCN